EKNYCVQRIKSCLKKINPSMNPLPSIPLIPYLSITKPNIGAVIAGTTEYRLVTKSAVCTSIPRDSMRYLLFAKINGYSNNRKVDDSFHSIMYSNYINRNIFTLIQQ